jgi:hypothetical protein
VARMMASVRESMNFSPRLGLGKMGTDD